MVLLFSLLGVIVSFSFPMIGGDFYNILAVVICCLFIVIHGVLVKNKFKNKPSKLVAAAEEPYLLGYLYTISALIAIAYQLSRQPLEISHQPVLFLAGVKLATSAFGLMTMMFIKSTALQYEYMDDTTSSLPREAQITDKEESIQKCLVSEKSLAESMKKLETNTSEILKMTTKANDKVSGLIEKTDETQKKMETLRDTSNEIQGTLENFVEMNAKLLERYRN
jgi:hypothetical protein